MTTSSSRLPNQLATFRFVDPTRAQLQSATAVFACSIVPFHSNTRMPVRVTAGTPSETKVSKQECPKRLAPANARQRRPSPLLATPARTRSCRRNRHQSAIIFLSQASRRVDPPVAFQHWQARWLQRVAPRHLLHLVFRV